MLRLKPNNLMHLVNRWMLTSQIGKLSGDTGDATPDSVTFIIAPRRAMIRPFLRQMWGASAEPMLERLGVNFDRLIQSDVHLRPQPVAKAS